MSEAADEIRRVDEVWRAAVDSWKAVNDGDQWVKWYAEQLGSTRRRTRMGDTVKAIVGSVVADGLALAAAFGFSVTTTQQVAILAFVGTATTAITAVVGWLETHHIRAAAVTDAATIATTAPVVTKVAS